MATAAVIHEPDAFSSSEWANAGPMALRSNAASPHAIGLVEDLLDQLHFPTTTLLKPSTVEKRRRALRALMADLLRLEARGLAGYHGTAPRDFPSQHLGFGYDVFVKVKDAMVAAGLLEFAKGHQKAFNFSNLVTGKPGPTQYGGGYQARFRLTAKALQAVHEAGIPLDDWYSHWSPPEPLQAAATKQKKAVVVVQLRATKGASWPPGRAQAPKGLNLAVDPQDPVFRALTAEVQAHNDFLSPGRVGGVDFIGLRRIFNNGDAPGFAWDLGGRFYSLQTPGMGKAYELMSRRAKITLDGGAVGEADMSASQLRLLYALLGEAAPVGMDDDLYCFPGADREAVKTYITQAFGRGSNRAKKWAPESAREYAKSHPGASL